MRDAGLGLTSSFLPGMGLRAAAQEATPAAAGVDRAAVAAALPTLTEFAKGAANWNDPVIDHLPAFQLADSLRHLRAHHH